MRLSTRLFWVAVVVGVVLRVLVEQSVGGRLDSDEAVVYLMARHGGGGWFFWGQAYGGTLLQLTAAAVFAVFGASVTSLQLVEALWWLAAVLLVRAFGTRFWGRFAGDLAGALLWLPGPALLWLTVRDPGFYGPAIALGAAVLLLALDDRELTPRRGLALGLCAGLAIWTSPLGLVYALPALVFTLLRRRPAPAGHLALQGGLLLGLLPLLVGKVVDTSPGFSQRAPLSELPQRSADVVFRLLPASWVGESVALRVLVGLLWMGLVLGGAALAWQRRSWTLLVLTSVALLSVLVVAGSNAILLPVSLRYGALLAPIPFLLLAAAIAALGRARWVGWLLVLLLAGWTLQVSDRVTGGFRPAGANHWEGEAGDLRRDAQGYVRPQAIDVPRLATHLESRGLTAVYASYWVAYALTAQSGERVTADPLNFSRYRPYATRAEAAPMTTVVVFTGKDNDRQLRSSPTLPPYTATEVAGFTVYVFDRQVPVDQLPRWTY